MVAVHKETRQPVAWFEEAAALEGKTPSHIECIRPWWADTVVDRSALRSLMEQFRQVVWQTLPQQDRWQEGWRMQWRVAPTVSDLHLQWLERTIAEAGWWWPRVRRANYHTLTDSSKQVVLWDWGMSAVRWSVWVQGRLVASVAHPELSLAEIAGGLVETERYITSRQFSQAALRDAQWSVRHPAFDLKTREPIFEPLSKTTLKTVQEQWLAAYTQAWKAFQASLPAESASQLAVSESYVVGAGAQLAPWIAAASQVTHLEWQSTQDSLYVEVRSNTS